MNVGLFDSFITRSWYHPRASSVWSDEGTLQVWLKVEAALARAQADLGLIPKEAAATIASFADIRHFDLVQLSQDIAFAQHPFVPVLRRYEQLCGEPAAGYLHWGATTQNIFDTANALQMQETHPLTIDFLNTALRCLLGLAVEHKDTLQAGRTHGQHALPMTFGFKAAAWADELERDRSRLEARFSTSFVVSMGGAIGTFSAMGNRGPDVERHLAEQLGLQAAGLPFRSSYDRVADYVCALGLLAGTVEKIAGDVVFLQRTELGELEEAFHFGKMGSSTMAQKRNPSTALMLISMARMLRGRVPMALEAMVRMDEGDSSATNVSDSLLPEIAVLAVSLADTLAKLVAGLAVHADVMRRNAHLTNGLIVSEAVMMRLSRSLGRHRAHHLLYEAAQHAVEKKMSFLQSLRDHPEIRQNSLETELTEALTVENYIGESARLVDEVVRRVARSD